MLVKNFKNFKKTAQIQEQILTRPISTIYNIYTYIHICIYVLTLVCYCLINGNLPVINPITCIYVYMYICIYVYMYICIYVYMYICIYVYMYKCINVYM